MVSVGRVTMFWARKIVRNMLNVQKMAFGREGRSLEV